MQDLKQYQKSCSNGHLENTTHIKSTSKFFSNVPSYAGPKNTIHKF